MQHRLFPTAVFLVTALITLTALAADAPAPAPSNPLAGVIDFHCHTAPDDVPRSINDFELVRLAKAAGMRGVVLKNHYVPTADRAQLAMTEIGGLEVFGGVVLNRSVGGLNPEAVLRMAQMDGGRGRVVWLPTRDAEAEVRQAGANAPFVSVVKDGQPVPELAAIFQVCADHNLVLCTGHSSAAEAIVLVEAAKKAGVKNVVVTHAQALPLGGATDEQLQKMADLGAIIECTWLAVLERDGQRKLSVDDYVRAIKKIGAEHFLISSDMGQTTVPVHPEAMRAFIAALKNGGLTDAEIDLVARKNPAQLLGLTAGDAK